MNRVSENSDMSSREKVSLGSDDLTDDSSDRRREVSASWRQHGPTRRGVAVKLQETAHRRFPVRLSPSTSSMGGIPWGLVLALIVEIVVFSAINSRYIALANLRAIAIDASFLLIMGVGTTACFISNTFDISFTAVSGVAGVVTAYLATTAHINVWLAAVIGICCCVALGLINGIVSAVLRVPAFIVTLAVLFVAYGIQLEVSGGNVIPVSSSVFSNLADGEVLGVPLPIVYMLIVALAAAVWLRWTVSGVHIYEIGSDSEAARRLGVRVTRLRIGILATQAFLAGIAGVLLVSQLSSATPTEGSTRLLEVIAAVVLGGTSLFGGRGGILGTLIGLLFIEGLNNGLVLSNVNPNLEFIIMGAFVLIAVSGQYFRRSERVAEA